ncbi:MAG: glycosyltransferase [Vicingaceae bacterium]
MTNRVLLISNNEICYNARLLKAADFLDKNGWEVTVFNGVTGIASEKVYRSTLKSRKWNVIENDISKRSLKSKIRWLLNGLLHKIVVYSVEKLEWKIWSKFYLNKTLLLAPMLRRNKYDWVIINLIDNLPFAVELKNKMKAKVIYDSQEYFVGQYAAFERCKYKWVVENEKKYIEQVDVLLATTQVMLDKIGSDYGLNIPSFRVRNVPTIAQVHSNDRINQEANFESDVPLRLVWHGMGIYLENRRGLHILIKAIANCKQKVHLFLQGKLDDTQKSILNNFIVNYRLQNKLTVLPPALPDKIVESLTDYDIGLTGELPKEENQELTSSNKLFDYIAAGLAVLASDVKGVRETIEEYKVGFMYKPGDYIQLSELIDELAIKGQKLSALKSNSASARKSLSWESDYRNVLSIMEN